MRYSNLGATNTQQTTKQEPSEIQDIKYFTEKLESVKLEIKKYEKICADVSEVKEKLKTEQSRLESLQNLCQIEKTKLADIVSDYKKTESNIKDAMSKYNFDIANSVASLDSVVATINTKEKEVAELYATIADLKGDNGRLILSINTNNDTIAVQESKIVSLSNTVDELSKKIELYNSKLSEQNINISNNESKIREQRDNLESIATSIADKNKEISRIASDINLEKQKLDQVTAEILVKNEDIVKRESIISERERWNTAKENKINEIKMAVEMLHGKKITL